MSFTRTSPTYHRVTTEHDQFTVTPEHPFWVQGEGWVPIKDIPLGMPVATATGDTMVMTNEVVNEPIQVFNFSVQTTPSYFIGNEQVWVHNASCEIGGGKGIGAVAPFKVDSKQLGKKLGKHVEDFGGNPANEADRKMVLDKIMDIGNNPEKVVSGTFAGQGIGGSRGDVTFRIKGNDVVVTKPDGTFVTILKDGVTQNPSVIRALKEYKN